MRKRILYGLMGAMLCAAMLLGGCGKEGGSSNSQVKPERIWKRQRLLIFQMRLSKAGMNHL